MHLLLGHIGSKAVLFVLQVWQVFQPVQSYVEPYQQSPLMLNMTPEFCSTVTNALSACFTLYCRQGNWEQPGRVPRAV